MFLGSEAAGQPLAFVPRTQARVNDRVLGRPLRLDGGPRASPAVVSDDDRSRPHATRFAIGATAHAIAVMGRQLLHMSRMVDDLLDAARLSTGKVSLIPHRLDIREVMTDAAADIAADGRQTRPATGREVWRSAAVGPW